MNYKLFAHRAGLQNRTQINCKISAKSLAFREYILTQHYLGVARNTTFEEVSCEVDE